MVKPAFEVLRAVSLDDGRTVVTADFGGVQLGSIYVIGGEVSWPRTARGFPLIAPSPELRREFDAEILKRVAGAR